MFYRRVAALAAAAAIITGACSTAGTAAPSGGGGGGAAGCTIGFSWNNYTEERWAKWDEPAVKAAIAAGGGTYISNDAKSSEATQATNVENLISQGAKVLVILAQNGTAIKPSVTKAVSEGIPVIAYDRLIEDPGVLYATFDNVEVGRMEAREIFKAKPKGNYVIIKGNKADANADFLRGGYEEIIGAAVKAQGLAGKVPVSGQDGDAAALNNVALGNQTVDVWKDARELGKAAGDAAIALCKDKDVKKVANTTQFDSPGKNKITSILLKPQPITKDNLNVVL